MKRAVITGTTGFIGAALAKTLIKNGILVYGVDRHPRYDRSDLFIPVAAEFSNYDRLPELIRDDGIDVFFHLAWEGGFTEAIRDYRLQMRNAAYAGDALMAAYGLGAGKFVYANTYNQYEIRECLSRDTFRPRYTCIYAAGKTAGGLICRTLANQLKIPYSAGLIPMPYGENNYSRQLVNVVIDALNHGESPKLVEGNNLYDLVYIQDIADALLAIGQKGQDQKDYYIGHRKLKTFREWITEIRDRIAPDVELKFGEYQDLQQIDYSRIDLDALYRDTGWECRYRLEDRIGPTAKWVNGHGWRK